MAMVLEREYDLSEIAEMLGMSTRWVRQRIRAGEEGTGPFFEHQRWGRKITMTEAQIVTLRASVVQAPPPPQSIATGRKPRSW